MMKDLTHLNNRFPGKTAFITGAGSGLGQAFAQVLGQNGWTLYLADLRPDSLNIYNGDNVHKFELDVSDLDAYNDVVSSISDNTRHIDLLINNAGIGDGAFFKEYDIKLWEKMIQVNLLGTFYGSRLMIPLMEGPQGGLIINIGSAAGFINSPGMSAYNVSKAAVYSLAETLNYELKDENIQVSVASPTFFKTNIMQDAKGAEIFIQFAEKQMKYSTTNADEMAEVILTQAAQGKFQIIFPKEARRRYWLKKWFPGLIDKKIDVMMARFKASK